MLGKYELNKIYNEDSYKAIKNIPDNSIDLIVIDPPYMISSLTGGKMVTEKGINVVNEEIGKKELDIGIDNKILDSFMRVMKKPNIYIWCNKLLIPKLLKFFVEEHDCKFDILSWHKPNAMPLCGGKYLVDTEYCLYFRKGVKLNTKYDTAKTYWLENININDKKLFMHPTIKPLNIIKKLIINSSNENDIVADFFIGSGTTAVACKELDRRYIGFEIDKEFHKIAVDRLNGITASGQISIFTDFD